MDSRSESELRTFGVWFSSFLSNDCILRAIVKSIVFAAHTLSEVIEIYRLSSGYANELLFDFYKYQILNSFPLPTFSNLTLALFKTLYGYYGLK